VPPAVVTLISTVPALPAGVVAVMVVSLTTVTLVAAAPPTVTPVAPVRAVPVIVSDVPPDVEPLVGLTEDTLGGIAAIVMVTARVESFATLASDTIEKLSVPTAPAAGVYVIWLSGS
jgi:hypothetical protein